MADITYSVKVNEETQEKLKALVIESGLNNKDFFTSLLSNYELQQAKILTPILESDINELETLTRRINTIYTNVSERFLTIQIENTEEKNRMEKESQEKTAILLQRVTTLENYKTLFEESEKEKKELKNSAEQEKRDLLKQIETIENSLIDKQAIIDNCKAELDTQTKIATEYRKSAEENTKLKEDITNLNKKVADLNRELEKQQETMSIEKEKALIEMREKHITTIGEIQADYHDKINEILKEKEQKNKPTTRSKPKNETAANKE